MLRCLCLFGVKFCFYFPFFLAITQQSRTEILSYESRGNLLSDIDVTLELLTRAKISFSTYMTLTKTMNPHKPSDCSEVLLSGQNKSGVYTIWPRNRLIEDSPLQVFCDMDTDGGGWIVLQRRGDFKRPIDYFNKDWESYKTGFGDIDKEFWLGNDNIFALTNQRAYSVRFDMESILGIKKYALYDSFWIEDEDRKYTLHIKNYSGDAGDSMDNHDNMDFTTNDQDNDLNETKNCGFVFKGGWWYFNSYNSFLNGLNHRAIHESSVSGVNWNTFTGYTESLLAAEIKIRPKKFIKIDQV